MAKRKRAYKRGYKKGRRSASKGGIMGYRLMDMSQGLYNADKLGYTAAADKIINGTGSWQDALNDIREPMADTGGLIMLAVDNAFIGVNRKLLKKFGGKFIRKFIA